jgi:glycosyltransferase involved in cell wall biosynthesis
VPLPSTLEFFPSPPPVLIDQWSGHRKPAVGPFTTIGNWEQRWREVTLDGDTYHWSKHYEFMKVIDLPRRTSAPLELALSSYRDEDRRMLENHGWRVRPGLGFSKDLDAYRTYIQLSQGEFSVAKDQNVRLRSGWFSERSATYLAAGRPVILQDTGFGAYLPTGEGLFAFSTVDEAAAALERVTADYARHSAAAAEIAREYLDAERVVKAILDRIPSNLPAAKATAG